MCPRLLHTAQIFQALGVAISINTATQTVHITGVGLHGLKQANSQLNVGNSGTGIRLISGVLAAHHLILRSQVIIPL